jgi:ParB family transcriptional regulator, chromosome partitioning protein
MGRRPVTGSAASTAASTPASVPVSSIAHNPRNPRDHYNDVDDLVASFAEVGVLQPLGIVRYEIFLTHYPQHEHEVGTYDWVVVNGNRRLAAARDAGLTDVPVVVLDRLGRDDHLDEAVLIENIHRAALPPLREAQALRLLVDRHGTQAAVAKRISKTEGFISQRLALLKLVPELQAAVESGDLLVQDARRLGKVPPSEQVDEWKRIRDLYAVKTARDEPSARNGKPYADAGERAAKKPQSARTPALKIGTPPEIAEQLRHHLTPESLAELIRLLTAK